MGVAVGVFVVVALSSVVRGVNESFARDVAAAGPDVVLRLPPADQPASRAVIRRDPSSCPERRNPAITIDEALGHRARCRRSTPSRSTSRAAAEFKYKDRSLNAGIEFYSPNWTDVDGGDIYPGPQLHARGERRRARVVIVERQARRRRCSATPIRSTRSVTIDGEQFTVIGLYHYTASPMGTPTSAGGGDSPKAIIPIETGRRHMNLWVRGNNLIVKPRDGVARRRRRRRRDGVPARRSAGCARATARTSRSSRRTG